MTEPLVSNFQYLTNKRVAQQVLTRTYVAPLDTPKYVFEFLKTLVMPASICKLGLLDLSISQTNNSLMKERIGSEQTTLGFNHYKLSYSDWSLNKINTFLKNTATSLGIDAGA